MFGLFNIFDHHADDSDLHYQDHDTIINPDALNPHLDLSVFGNSVDDYHHYYLTFDNEIFKRH